MSEWLDSDGYPTKAALKRIRRANSPREALDAMADCWWGAKHGVSFELRPEELAVVQHHGEPEKFIRFATGGWSGNELALSVLEKNFMGYYTWRLSAAGGLHIFEYPE